MIIGSCVVVAAVNCRRVSTEGRRQNVYRAVLSSSFNDHFTLTDVISVDEVIDEWTLSTRILHQNFSFLRTFDPARIAVACIRHGHAFLEVFLKQARSWWWEGRAEEQGISPFRRLS